MTAFLLYLQTKYLLIAVAVTIPGSKDRRPASLLLHHTRSISPVNTISRKSVYFFCKKKRPPYGKEVIWKERVRPSSPGAVVSDCTKVLEEENFPALIFLLFPRFLLGPLPAAILPSENLSVKVTANFRSLCKELRGSTPGPIGVAVERSLFSYLTINPGEGNNSSFLGSASEFDSCWNLRTIVENIVFHGKQKPPSQQI